MACYLGDYHQAATNREEKLHRAIKSFLIQDIGELIVVSDGCEKTNKIITRQYPTVQLVSIPKQAIFSGKVRQVGITIAKHNWICYLDSDDEFLPGHLQTLIDNIDTNIDWFYYDDIVGTRRRKTSVGQCQIGTSTICHKTNLTAVWPDGYMHDWHFVRQLGDNYKKIDHAGYVVHHVPRELDN
jgi:glycosyltransferase involved in cell wall biosynthesis